MTPEFHCKGCEHRFVGCHVTCKDYNSIKEVRDAKKRKEYFENYVGHELYTFRSEGILRALKRAKR